ncbi:MAG: lysophospholipid acyltransferase family protein [Betaproteobacteria bacterium]
MADPLSAPSEMTGATRAGRAPLALRLLRYLRVSIHVFQGIGTTAFVFPMVALPRRRELIKRWSVKLLRIMNIDSRVRGIPSWAGNVLVVANHISWLDIFVLNTIEPGRFIAKAELASWPLVGHLIAGCGTLFLDRSSRRDAHRINEQARSVLAAGDTITIFPEGTTTDGTTLLAFHGSLLQPVVDAAGDVQPIAIRYCNQDGTYNATPAYVGDTTFMASFWRVLGERRLVVEVTLPPPIPAAGRHRRQLSEQAQRAISAALGLPAAGSVPGTMPHRPA